MAKHFGEHLTIDGYGGDEKLLDDQELVRSFLNDIPAKLGMTPLSPASVVFAPGNEHKDPGGWSGFVIIAESHISVHTFPKRGFLSADVYTCQNNLDTESVKDYFKDTFSLKNLESNFIKRGLDYPAENIY